jgi:hypothetical protein
MHPKLLLDFRAFTLLSHVEKQSAAIFGDLSQVARWILDNTDHLLLFGVHNPPVQKGGLEVVNQNVDPEKDMKRTQRTTTHQMPHPMCRPTKKTQRNCQL